MAVDHPSEAQVEASNSPGATSTTSTASGTGGASKAEQIQQFVDMLANQIQAVSSRVKFAVPERSVTSNLAIYAEWLAEAHRYFSKASRQEITLTYASEWVLDNYYVIRQATREISNDLPHGYYSELPKLSSGPNQGFPRIYVIVSAALGFQNLDRPGIVNLDELQTILIGLQERVSLTMGELWAVPIFLRYRLIEIMSHTLVDVIQPKSRPNLPEPAYLPEIDQLLPGYQHSGENAGSTTASTVANAVLSLRTISDQDWNEYFESISRVERILREDPAEIYPQMDFKTRDLYRKKIEELSEGSSQNENLLADMVVEMAREGAERNGHEGSLADQRMHVGYYLIGAGRPALEKHIDYHASGTKALRQWVLRTSHATPVYLGAILLLTAILLVFLLWMLPASTILVQILVGLLGIVPAMTIATNLINWLTTLLLPPSILPKLVFKQEIPAPFHTAVVVPALINSPEEVDALTRQMEMHYLRNPEPGMVFILLTDFSDAEQETLPEDEALVQRAGAAIDALNEKYAAQNGNHTGRMPFFFLHRPRLWNPQENRWMGWERKRGKLHELNLLLQGKPNGSFIYKAGDLEALQAAHIRFVITLDADTILPRGAAARLAGTIAHPLNRPVFGEKAGDVLSGYTILQPRIEISAASANRSWFTRIFSGDTGLDLYSLAVSDTYQDLFGEGSFVGKGIYDVEGFERSVASRIPENSLLSHDLLEGLMGRAGLVTDITLIEDYPPNYFVQTLRQRRWIRGDWQLLPWLFQRVPSSPPSQFSAIDRWKIIDNLRRSLLAPDMLLLFTLGVLLLPDPAWPWSLLVFLTLGIPLLTSLVRGVVQVLYSDPIRAAFRPATWDLFRLLLAVAFLPYEAYLAADAILTTLYRLLISHRQMLQWTSAAQTAQLFGSQEHRRTAWEKLGIISLLALVLGALIILFNGPPWIVAIIDSLGAVPVLILWLFSPLIAREINQPIIQHTSSLSDEQEALLRQVARRTWAFFERYVGPEDHWLPPDHFQESPVGMVAHRTSPTNIGLLLTSTLAAYDLGYLDLLGLATRLSATFETLEQLSRFQGHFLNWYDTLTLQPLNPRYISTVDSGNLAANLIITAHACQEMTTAPIFRWTLWQGYLDTLAILSDTLADLRRRTEAAAAKRVRKQAADRLLSTIVPDKTHPPAPDQHTTDQHTTQPSLQFILAPITDIEREINRMVKTIETARNDRGQWYAVFLEATGPFWQKVSNSLLKLITAGRADFDLETLRSLQRIASQIEQHHLAVQRTINELVPWIPLLQDPPEALAESPYRENLDRLRAALPYGPVLGNIRQHIEAAHPHLQGMREKVLESDGRNAQPPPLNDSAPITAWLDTLEQALEHAGARAGAMQDMFTQLSDRAEQYVREMDFRFLYNSNRRIFHIGYNLDAGQPDANYYDLLASEARIASLIAIAQDVVPQSHWLQLSRPVTSVEGLRVLLSWSATMFEYLMPPLFVKSYTGTLLAESARGAVEHQIAYGKSKGVPWGISESGFYRFDANQNYQYRAFGVPGLGFKRGLGDDLVIAPYASLMAVCYEPQAVIQNVHELIEHQSFGLYGFYEAIDFTADRLLVGQPYALVREYMSHHQGMVLMALDNYFLDDVMVRRMHADPRIQSIDILLQEQVPLAAPLQSPYTEDVRGVQRPGAVQAKINPWSVPVQTPIPQVTLLSNSNYSVLISNSGSGYSAWRDIDLTRWRADSALDEWGSWIYIQDLEEKPGASPLDTGANLWSAGFQPVPGDPNDVQVTFFAHMAVIHRNEHGIISTMEVTVPPDDSLEIRRLHLNNTTTSLRRLRLVSYGEVILSQQATDVRHPAFNRLFVESEFLPDFNLQIFRRRPRSDSDAPLYMGHMLTIEGSRPLSGTYAADRAAFIGRGRDPRNPAALDLESGTYGSGDGATLDPIFSIGQEVDLEPYETMQLAYLTFAASSREEILAMADRYHAWAQIERAFHQADLAAQAWLGQGNIDTGMLKNILEVFSGLLYPYNAIGAAPEEIAANRLSQPGLWRFGISGDYPILLVELDDPRHLELVRQAMECHRFLRSHRFMADLVILNQQQTDYGAELNGLLYRLASRVNSDQWLNQRGGIFILYSDQMHPEERTLLRAAARVVLRGERGTLDEQLPGYSIQVQHLPEFAPSRGESTPPPPLPRKNRGEEKEELQFFNGHGGFSEDGHEYVIEVTRDKPTPAPWVNVIGYPTFGFLISEAGSQTTWAMNSGENRLTPWLNDPVRDLTGEALYLRDEETGEVWTPTPLPAGEDQTYRVRHSAGYTIFEHESHGLEQQLTFFASPEDPVKIIYLHVKNTWNHTRRITVTQYVEWVLGTTHATSQPFIIPEYDPSRECLFATNPYNTEFAERVAFLTTSNPIHGLTADRTEFIGRNGSMNCPAALRRIGLERRITPGEDPCAVLQVHFDLQPGAIQEVYFILGQGNNKNHALQLVDRYRDPANVGAAWEKTHAFWNQLLDAIQVHTPEPAVDLILNRWLLYQTLSCRIWGRTALYQSSGAFGFRDQLQDVMAVLPFDPTIARGQILNAAHHQFEAGDVLHWWHPPSGRGVRTRFSDDLLWLPYVTAVYVETTGDTSILNEKISFLQAPPLKEGENERYGLYASTEETYPVLEHCRRAIDKGATRGPHGLPLIGTGDWNDGLNLVGVEGQGESVWMAWFLYDVLQRFANLYENSTGKAPEAARIAAQYRQQAKDYIAHVEQAAWDGDWYRRAYYDDGAPLGSREDAECKIDSIAQSWSILSGANEPGANAANPQHAQRAMQSVLDQLVHPEQRLILLFTPPFDKTPRDPGYIKGYLPGTRENGGQYTHAATWTAWAYARLKDGRQAGQLFNLLNPIYQSDNLEKAAIYRVEPYVICADIYSAPPYQRRGGWTWYTGSAAWMYRLGLEAILGFQKTGDRLRMNPVIPPEWDGFTIDYRFGKAVYHIQISNPQHLASGIKEIAFDKKLIEGDGIPLTDDGNEHQISVVMGEKEKQPIDPE
jgi:cyclic beta-1,2-glucan synthetase